MRNVLAIIFKILMLPVQHMMRLKLHWQILIAIGLAVFLGLIWNVSIDNPDPSAFQFVGNVFLGALKMIVVPLILSSVIVSIAGIGGSGNLGRLGGFTLLYYLSTSFIAIMIGLILVNIIKPGIIDDKPARYTLEQYQKEPPKAVITKAEEKGASSVWEIFLRMFPPNIINAAGDNNQLLGIIVFAILFGFFLARVEEPYADTLFRFWQGVFQVMMKITDFVILFSPIGVFGLVLAVVATSGFAAIMAASKLVITVLLALGLHFCVVMPLILYFIVGIHPLKHYKAMAPALLTAFSTSSSSATLPLTMECVERNVGVSKRTTNFVLPLGATVNMDGTALYECVAAIFIAQALGVPLDFADQFKVLVIALLTSIGVAGVPHASLVAIVIILNSVGLDVEAGIALILITDKILDMCRTTVNVYSDSCGATVIAKIQGEKDFFPDENASKHKESVP